MATFSIHILGAVAPLRFIPDQKVYGQMDLHRLLDRAKNVGLIHGSEASGQPVSIPFHAIAWIGTDDEDRQTLDHPR